MPLSFEARLRCSVVPLLFRQALTIYRAHFRTFISLALVTILPLFGTYLVGLLAPIVGYRNAAIAYVFYGIQGASIFLGFSGTPLLIARFFIPAVSQLLIVEGLDRYSLRTGGLKPASFSRPAVAAVFASFALLFAAPAAVNLVRGIHGFQLAPPFTRGSAFADLAARFTEGLPLHVAEFTILVLIIPMLGITYALLVRVLRAREGIPAKSARDYSSER